MAIFSNEVASYIGHGKLIAVDVSKYFTDVINGFVME